MRRTDRLMQLVTLLRDGKLHKGEDLAAALDVSLRTIYRDMDKLAASGVPVEGERGVGYHITSQITLPPINMTMDELEALHLGLAALGQSGDPDLERAAQSLAGKIDEVLPEDATTGDLTIYPFADAALGFRWLPFIRQAIRARQKLSVTTDTGTRTVRPLRLDYWGRLWTVLVWCEAKRDFDEVRLDQITSLKTLPQLFIEEDGKRLSDYKR